MNEHRVIGETDEGVELTHEHNSRHQPIIIIILVGDYLSGRLPWRVSNVGNYFAYCYIVHSKGNKKHA